MIKHCQKRSQRKATSRRTRQHHLQLHLLNQHKPPQKHRKFKKLQFNKLLIIQSKLQLLCQNNSSPKNLICRAPNNCLIQKKKTIYYCSEIKRKHKDRVKLKATKNNNKKDKKSLEYSMKKKWDNRGKDNKSKLKAKRKSECFMKKCKERGGRERNKDCRSRRFKESSNWKGRESRGKDKFNKKERHSWRDRLN